MAAVVGGGITGIAIVGTATFVPPQGLRQVSNAEIHRLQASRGERPMSDEWLTAAGVSSRWWSSVPGEPHDSGTVTTDELLAGAAAAALADAGVRLGDVDLLIAATTTPSRWTTSMAAMTGGRLGWSGAAFDVRAGCASASYALAMAYGQLAVGARSAVVTCAERLSTAAPGAGPLPYVAADAAAAVVLVRTDDRERGMVGSWLSGDGSASSLAGAPGALPPTAADVADDRFRLVADKRFDVAVTPWWAAGPQAVLASTGVRPDEVAAFVTNQAHRGRFTDAAAAAGLPPDAVVDVIGETANAGAASQLVALDRARRDGRAADGSLVMLTGVGGGISAATLLIRA